MAGLTSKNFRKGMLIDDEWMGGVSEHPEKPGEFAAFVIQHSTGETLAYQAFPTAEEAVTALNEIRRSWSFQGTGGCGGCVEGDCGGGRCPKRQQKSADHSLAQACDSECLS